jgi:hypothetical protein
VVGEDAGHRACEGLTVDGPAGVRHLVQDLLQAVDNARKQLPRHLPCAVDGSQNLLGLAVQAPTQLGDLVPGPRPVIGGDGGHTNLAN